MEVMTAQQAAEYGKTLNFEKVWAALMETKVQMADLTKKTDAQIADVFKSIKENGIQMADLTKKTDAQIADVFKSIKENGIQIANLTQKTDTQIADLSKSIKENGIQIANLTKNVGGISRSMGRWTEEMCAAKLCEKLNVFGYEFTQIGQRIRLRENEQVIAEIDLFLENGDVAMPVEVKTDLNAEDVDEQIERIGNIRRYMDNHGDKRNLVGAVAGAIVPENVCRYAQKKGLYVLVQSGDSVAIAAAPQGFTPRKW